MTRKCTLLLVAALLAVSVGCWAEEGANEGAIDGLSTAISSLITAPVNAWIQAVFGA
jgi:hypothetical protein